MTARHSHLRRSTALTRNSKLVHQLIQHTQAGILIWGPGGHHDGGGARAAKRSLKDRQVVVVQVGVAHEALKIEAVHSRGVTVEDLCRGGHKSQLATAAALHIVTKKVFDCSGCL